MKNTYFNTILADAKLTHELKLHLKPAIQRHFELPDRGVTRRITFGATKLYTQVRVALEDWDKWNYVSDELILGKLPFLTECDDIIQYAKTSDEKKSHQKPLGLIVSVVDYFELGGNAFLKKIATPLDWKNKNVEHYSLPIADFGADVPVTAIIHAIDAIRKCVLENKSVYIHCKAGRGRSAMLSAIYLALFDNACIDLNPKIALDNAIEKIKSQRCHIVLDSIKYQKAFETVQTLQKIILQEVAETQVQDEEKNIIKKLDILLSKDATKMEIAQLASFKELAFYGASILGSSNRTNIIKMFFKKILNAENSDWLLSYFKELQDLRDAQPILFSKRENNLLGLVEDRKKRIQLCDDFDRELADYICSKLPCDKNELPIVQKEEKSKNQHSLSDSTRESLVKYGLYAASIAGSIMCAAEVVSFLKIT